MLHERVVPKVVGHEVLQAEAVTQGVEPFVFTSPPSRVLSDFVADQLREAIVHGRLAPGQHLVEKEIATAMSMSRGPVRDALRTLEIEGLVVRYPHRGTFVAGLSAGDAEEIYSLREMLETLAVDWVIRCARDEQFDELDILVDRMAALAETDYSQVEATELDLQFHDLIFQMSGHNRLQATWTALRGQVRILVLAHRHLDPTDFRERGIAAHRHLAACLRGRDPAVAQAAMREHLAQSYGTVAGALGLRNIGSAGQIPR